MNPIQFFQSADVTLSNKLLELVYVIIGLVCVYAGLCNLRDDSNEKRVGTCVFWSVLGLLFIIGPWVPSEVAGALVVVMVLPPIFRQVDAGSA